MKADCEKRINTAGMTLIEVILAALILSVGLGGLLLAASRSMAVLRAARMFEEARWTLSLGELEYPPVVTEDIQDMLAGPVEYDNGYTFERMVEESENDDGLHIMRTRVTWGDRGRERFEEVVQYVYIPEE